MKFTRRQALKSAGLASMLAAAGASTVHASESKRSWNGSFDVVVAGAGAAGAMAALFAAEKGAEVLLVQAGAFIGGSSMISSGWIRSTGTKWHSKKGVKDSVQAYKEDIIAYGQGTRSEAKAQVIAERSADFVDYLIDAGVPFSDDEDRFNGGDALRIVKAQGAGGAIMKGLSKKISECSRIKVMTSTKISDVLVDDERSKVEGVKLEERGGKALFIKTKSVVLATGGYGRNQEYVEKFTHQWAATGRIMDVGCKGDGLKIAANLGAGTQNLHIAMVCPTLEVTKNLFYSSAPILNGAVFVNEKGRRFTNEYVIYTQTNIDMLKQQKVWEILTPEQHPATFEAMKKAEVLHKCDTIEDLAKLIGCPVDGLHADIEEHNRVTALPPKERVDAFGRRAFNLPLKAPYYALEVKPVMIETVGGITINEKSEVTTLMGEKLIDGLYAAGALAFGEHFSVGYRSGDAYVYSGVTGMVAGEQAADFALD